jgi:hypothetical protein
MEVSSCVGGAASIVLLSGVPSSSGYVLGARLVRRQGLERVKALMAAPPSLEAALTAVKDKVCMFAYEMLLFVADIVVGIGVEVQFGKNAWSESRR